MHYIELMHENDVDKGKAFIEHLIETMGEEKYLEMDVKRIKFAKFWNETYPENPMPVTDDEVREAIKSGNYRM
jgi:hypothetical protein